MTPTELPALMRDLLRPDTNPWRSGRSYGSERSVSLSKPRGKNIAFYFYPKDDTQASSREDCSFQENKSKLNACGTRGIGVSPDSIESHSKFRKKYGLEIVLVADQDH